ncbi:MAG: hypothetical protein MRY83_11070, partial [Flavobacteriales bacterium]|nr:hypothetical protein [Flavobacteriales bacterium]
FVDQFDAFKVTATDSSGKSRFFALESVKPYREDEAGSWYYRWWVKEDFYKSNEEAESIFKSTYDGLSSYDDMENKGYNARILLHKDRIYSVTGGCKEGRFIEEWFQILVDKMKITLETGNTIESNCGGQIKLK